MVAWGRNVAHSSLIGAFWGCLLSGILWYAFILVLISVLRFVGVTMSGIWPLKP